MRKTPNRKSNGEKDRSESPGGRLSKNESVKEWGNPIVRRVSSLYEETSKNSGVLSLIIVLASIFSSIYFVNRYSPELPPKNAISFPVAADSKNFSIHNKTMEMLTNIGSVSDNNDTSCADAFGQALRLVTVAYDSSLVSYKDVAESSTAAYTEIHENKLKLESDLIEGNNIIANLKEEVNRLTAEALANQALTAKLTTDKNESDQKLENLRVISDAAAKQYSASRMELEEGNKNLSSDLDKEKAVVAHLYVDKAAVEGDLVSTKEQVQSLTEDGKKSDATIKELQSSLLELGEKYSALQVEQNSLSQSLAEKEVKLAEHKQKLSASAVELETYQSRLATESEKVSSANKQISSLSAKVEVQSAEFQSKIKAAEDQHKLVLSELRQKLETKEDEMRIADTKLKNLERILQIRGEHIEDMAKEKVDLILARDLCFGSNTENEKKLDECRMAYATVIEVNPNIVTPPEVDFSLPDKVLEDERNDGQVLYVWSM